MTSRFLVPTLILIAPLLTHAHTYCGQSANPSMCDLTGIYVQAPGADSGTPSTQGGSYTNDDSGMRPPSGQGSCGTGPFMTGTVVLPCQQPGNSAYDSSRSPASTVSSTSSPTSTMPARPNLTRGQN